MQKKDAKKPKKEANKRRTANGKEKGESRVCDSQQAFGELKKFKLEYLQKKSTFSTSSLNIMGDFFVTIWYKLPNYYYFSRSRKNSQINKHQQGTPPCLCYVSKYMSS